MKTIIETAHGKVKGEKRQEGYIYHSVPYAKTERFTDPKPYNWHDVFDATKKQVNCHQRFEYVDEAAENGFYYREFDYMRDSDYSESPMTMTIITPLEGEKLPVVAYVHGGSFENGCIEDMPFGDSFEYAKRGIILVSIGYRLNVFGLYDTGNYGLKDQVFAIDWLKENISAFGGDGEHIILMGQSAGAMCITDLLNSEVLEGKIKGAVLMSGGGVLPKIAGAATQQENHPFWLKVMEEAGCENEEQLKAVGPKTLWQAWYNVSRNKKYANMHTMQPGVDGKFITETPQAVYKKLEDIDVPLMIGITSQDMLPFMILGMGLKWGVRNAKHNRSKVYGYLYDHTMPGEVYKAYHAADLWFMFGNLKKCWRPLTDVDYQLSKKMIDYNANFIKTLNPNGVGLERWPAIDKGMKKYRYFGDDERVLIGPMAIRKKLFHTMFKDKGPI